MYNDASTEKAVRRSSNRDATARAKSHNITQATPESPESESCEGFDKAADNNCEDNSSPITASVSKDDAKQSSNYSSDLEEFIQSEQANRVALLNQVASLREQVWFSLPGA
jgi:hypothetical protein